MLRLGDHVLAVTLLKALTQIGKLAWALSALRWLAGNAPPGGKVFVEPHLADRLNVAHPAIRFQGCRAARHDDHIHVQI